MRRPLLAFLAAAVVLAVGASSAAAKPVPTDIGLNGVGPLPSGDVVVYGQLDSAKPKCLANRRIAIVVSKESGEKIFDVAHSSDHGAWLGRGAGAKLNGTGISLRLSAKRVKAGGKTIRCGGQKVKLS